MVNNHENIENLEIYNERMNKSILDKMFFLDKIPDDVVIVDWGCGNGKLLDRIKSLFPYNTYMGYDISNTMMHLCKKNLNDIFVTSDLDNLINKLNNYEEKDIVINLSSVIHEVYSYKNTNEISNFWKNIFNIGDYIVIRDMIPSNSMNRESYQDDIRKIYQHSDRKYLLDFISKSGDIINNKNLIHYLLKYRYKDNWEREVRENYFPLTKETLYTKIPNNFKIRYEEHFILPFIQRKIEEDFNILVKDNTHLKTIIEKKDR